MELTIIYIGLGTLIILAVAKPRWAMLAYIVSLGWTPAGIAQNLYGRLDFEDIILFIMSLAGLRVLVTSPRKCWTPLTKILLAYWVFTLIGNYLGYSKDPFLADTIGRQMAKDVCLLLLFSGMSGCLRDGTFFRRAAIATLIATIGVALSVYVGRFAPTLPIVRYWAVKVLVGDRSVGMFVTPYLSGVYLATGIGLLVAYFIYSKALWQKIVSGCATLAFGFALLLGQSRSNYLAVAIVLLAGTFTRIRNLVWGMLLVGVILVAIISDTSLMERLIGRFESRSYTTLGGRTLSWKSWIETFDGTTWIFGNGIQYSIDRSGIGSHSCYLDAWADGGLGALIAFLAFWPVVFHTWKRIPTCSLRDRDKIAGYGFCWCSIALLVSSMMIGFTSDTYYRTIVTLVLAMGTAPCLMASSIPAHMMLRYRVAPKTALQ
ncbi:MAG: O-antigen ligase family protein [Pirellulales bacterium]|nr:O-antigen ligase family protein [Pirellulales bacterium]